MNKLTSIIHQEEVYTKLSDIILFLLSHDDKPQTSEFVVIDRDDLVSTLTKYKNNVETKNLKNKEEREKLNDTQTNEQET